MKTYEVVVEATAMEELESAYRWIAQNAPEDAVRWYNRLMDELETLQIFPMRCPKAPEATSFDRDIRQMIYGNYRVLFTLEQHTVHIIHVRHAARLPIRPPQET